MVLKLNTGINIPDFEFSKKVLQEVNDLKGIPFDGNKLMESKGNLEAKADELKKEIKETLSTKIDRISWIDYTGRTRGRDHILTLICKYYDYPDDIFINPKNNSQYVTNEEVVGKFKTQFMRDRGETPKLILLWEELKTLNHAISNANQLNKAKFDYMDKHGDPEDGIFYVYPEFNIGSTGRISTKQPAIQSLVNDYKNCIVAPEGYKIMHMDVSGQEVHILMCGILENGELLSKYIEKEDPYLTILEQLDLPQDSEHRELAKIPILGLMNGMGRQSIRREMGNSGEIADMMINLIEKDRGYVRKVNGYVSRELKKPNKYRKGMFGTQFPVDRWGNPNTQLKNGFFQVTAAEIMSLTIQALYEATYNIDPTLDTIRLLTTIYDEYIFLVRNDYLKEGKKLVEDYCLPLVNNWPRFLGEIKMGQHYVAG